MVKGVISTTFLGVIPVRIEQSAFCYKEVQHSLQVFDVDEVPTKYKDSDEGNGFDDDVDEGEGYDEGYDEGYHRQ